MSIFKNGEKQQSTSEMVSMEIGAETRCEIKVKAGSTPKVPLKGKIMLELPLNEGGGKKIKGSYNLWALLDMYTHTILLNP